MMADFIQREAMLRLLKERKADYIKSNLTWAVITAVECDVRDMPAADIAPVVRCKECAYARPTVRCSDGKQAGIWCSYHDIVPVDADDFCSHGMAR